MQKKPRLLRKTDLFFPVCIILLAVFLIAVPFLRKEEGATAVVTYEGGRREISLALDATYTFESNGHTVILTVEDGEIFVSESTCHDGTCRRMGKISSVGENILCAKAALSVRIQNENGKGGFDAVAN